MGEDRQAGPRVLGHRGASDEAPENTLAAFRLAMAQGADGVELDVRRCAGGEVVVHHDPDTGRTAGVALRVGRTPLAALRALDVGGWKGAAFAGERIPLLAEVLEALPGALVNVELKSDGVPDLGLAPAVARVLRAAGTAERCIVSSFDPALLAAFRLAAPGVATGVLLQDEEGGRWRLQELVGTRLLRARAVHPRRTLVTPERAAAWARRGLQVNVWTVDDPEELRRLAGLGVHALITNRPAAAREALAMGVRSFHVPSLPERERGT